MRAAEQSFRDRPFPAHCDDVAGGGAESRRRRKRRSLRGAAKQANARARELELRICQASCEIPPSDVI
jgi:hypothetical protein